MEGEEVVGLEDGDCCEWMDAPQGGGGGGGGRGDRKRRFSEEQIKSLESMFATQTKLEPRQKLQLARELGLQPRQVAIWFQNKRARWKSKQLEREYAALRDDYDALLRSYESLKKEKQVLLSQLEKLAGLLQEPRSARSGRIKRGDAGDRGDIADGYGDMRSNTTLKEDADARAAFYSNEGDNNLVAELGEEEANLFRGQPAHGGFASSVEHGQFHFQVSWPPSDQTCSSSQWWGFE